MDSGTLGKVIKVMNLATGIVVGVYAGLYLMLFQLRNLGCDFTFDETAFRPAGPCCAVNPKDLDLPEDPTAPPLDPELCFIKRSFFTDGNFGVFVIATYMIPFGAILFFYELTTKRSGAEAGAAEGGDYGSGVLGSRVNAFRAFLTRYFGFIFFYRKRMQFMIFVGILCLGNINNQKAGFDLQYRNWGPPVTGGVVAMLNALFHFVVRMQHPEFDKGMQDQLAAANDVPPDSAAQAYRNETPSYNAGATSTNAHVPPATGPNIYGPAQPTEDGGTAI